MNQTTPLDNTEEIADALKQADATLQATGAVVSSKDAA
jgi:hypothetical protein